MKIQKILIKNHVVPFQIGLYDEEKGRFQNICFNIEIHIKDERFGLTKKNYYCYDLVIEEINRLASLDHVGLIETLAEDIAKFSLKDERVSKIVIEIMKLERWFESTQVGISIERTRGDFDQHES